jgi:ABC-type branched-subunit amino acid transport system substrate-binding protein
VLACRTPSPPSEPIAIGLLLSYSGPLAANSINSERALRMAIEAANATGGIDGRPLRLIARDTRSSASKVKAPALELLDAGAALFIGPDVTDLVSALRPLLQDRTMLLPAFTTASDIEWKRSSWFVMGPPLARVGCELVNQMRADGRQKPVVIVAADAYNSSLSWDMTNKYGLPKHVLPASEASTVSSVAPIAAMTADAYVLATSPPVASSLFFALTAIGADAVKDPTRWYLSPTLHTPAFLDWMPKGSLTGAHGTSPGTVAGAGDFRVSFFARWQDAPLDDAYPFFDAGAVAALALQHAVSREGVVPDGTGLGSHVQAVTHPGGHPIRWNELAEGLARIHDGEDVEYLGLSGSLAFDLSGQTPGASTKWWTIDYDQFVDVPAMSGCR